MYENQENTEITPELSAFLTDYNEKRRIHRTAWAIAVPGIIFFLVSVFLGTALALLGARFGVDASKIQEFLSEPGVSALLQIALSIFLMTVPFIISAKVTGVRISDIGGFNKPKKGTAAAGLLFGIGFCAFANVIVSLAGRVFEQFGFHYSLPESKYPEGISGFLLAVIATAIVPALVEEFAFRGIVLGLLRPFGEAFAVICSSAVFGILHGNFEQMPFAFLVGLVLGFIRIKSESLVVCMVVHAANNMIAVLTHYMDNGSTAVANIIYTAYVMLALVLSVLGVIWLKEKNAFSFRAPERKITAKKTYVYFLLSPAIIIFTILFLFRALIFVFL